MYCVIVPQMIASMYTVVAWNHQIECEKLEVLCVHCTVYVECKIFHSPSHVERIPQTVVKEGSIYSIFLPYMDQEGL